MGRDQELPTQGPRGVLQTRQQGRDPAAARVEAEAATDGTGCRDEAERSRSARVAPASLDRRAQGFHSITVNGNWRVIFRFVGQDVELVDYLDYH